MKTKSILLNSIARPFAAAALASTGLFATAGMAQENVDAVADEEAEPDASDGVIIVTAQRRAQDLQDVPAAVTALSAAALEQRQVVDTNDLQNQIPNVVISTGTGTSSSARIFFRGVGEDESRGAIDPAVGIYIDNVYLGRTVGSLIDLVDVDQVEVLRGPQGTLYGRNTNGGAIKVTSKRPELGDTYLTGEVGYGNFDRIQAKASANFAAWDSGAIRISGLYRQSDGYVTLNPTGDLADIAGTKVGGEDVFAFRASLYGELNDNWSFLAAFDYTKDDSEPVPSSFTDETSDPSIATDVDGDIFTVEPLGNADCSAAVPLAFRPVGCFTEFEASVEAYGVSYELTGEFDTFSITSITAFRAMNDDLSSHITFPYFQETDQSQFSQEVLVNSDFEGPFNFTAGAYYYTEDAFIDYVFFFPFDVDIQTESFALFGQGEVEFGGLTLTGGLRWTNEERDVLGNAGPPLTAFGTGIERNFDTDNITWTAKAGYDITPDVRVYASYATGFKSPGASPDCFSPVACFLPVDEESLDSIEVGLRTRFLDGRGTFNATYFYNDYQDLQISGTRPDGGFTRINAGEARIQGVELEASIEATDGLTIYGNASWLDAEYRALNFTQAGLLSGSSTTAAGPTCTNADPMAANYEQQIIDCALDLELKGAPEWKGLLGFNYEALVGDGEIFFGGDASYESDSFALVANGAGSLSEPGLRIDARAGYRAPGDAWTVTVWGKNLTDREYFRAATNTGGGGNQVYPAPPLTFGVTVGFRFD